MFELVLAITIASGDIDASERAYREFLDYEVVTRQTVSAQQAEVWATPDAAGREAILMRPASGREVYIRFVESEPNEQYEPLTTYGWNATELLVQDVDAMHERLRDSAFRVIGEPAYLTPAKVIKAMQVVGPSSEVVYLTQFSTERLFQRYDRPTSAVDRAFILIIGGPDHDALVQFYDQFLGHPVEPFGEFPVPILSKALQLPADTLVPLSTAQLGGRFRFELDGFPDAATVRMRDDGRLPGAMAMVTVTTDELDARTLLWRSPPKVLNEAPYHGRRVGVAIGPAGEWLEVVEDSR